LTSIYRYGRVLVICKYECEEIGNAKKISGNTISAFGMA
jgi:hypothetical protein